MFHGKKGAMRPFCYAADRDALLKQISLIR